MVDLNAAVWGGLDSAGNDADECLRCLLEEPENFRENMENLSEDISHQLSWYSATAYVLPHVAALCRKLPVADKLYLTAQMGAAIAAESEGALEPGSEAYREFHEGLDVLRLEAKELIANPEATALLKEDSELAQMFALAALAILGDRKHAYGFYLLSGYCWEEGPAACTCGWNDELLPVAGGSDCLEPASIAPWDGKSLEEEAVWFQGLLVAAGDDQILPAVPLVYGTGVCPACGKREAYWSWFDRFMQEY